MSSYRLFSALLAVILLTKVPWAPAYAQNNFIGVITKLIEEQRALAERRRQESIAVKRMQLGLKALGYYKGAIDGDLGTRTQAALLEYRRSAGRSEYDGLSLEEVQEIEARASEAAVSESDVVSGRSGATSLIRADAPRRLDAALSNAAAWIVIASRETAEESLSVAEEYVQSFPSTAVMRSSNGRYAIVAGWLNKDLGRPLKDALIAQNLIPDDSFLSSGDRFGPPVWAVAGQLIHSRADLLNYTLLRASPDVFRGLGGGSIATYASRVSALPKPSDYLSLRTSNAISAKEVKRLPEGTLLKVIKSEDGWHEVRLLNGMAGWVSSKYVTKSDETASDQDIAEQPRTEVAQNEGGGNDAAAEEWRATKTKEAMTLLDDLAVYLKLHPEIPDIASIAEEITKLQQAIQQKNANDIDGGTQRLKSRMANVTGFAELERARIEERRAADIKALGDAVSLASKHTQFLRAQIADNVTSPNTPKLAALLKQYDLVLKQPDLAVLTDLNGRVKQLVAELNLTSAYDAAMSQLRPEGPTTPKSEPVGITVTDHNRFLLEGDRGDWVLIFNAGGKAPNVARNIRGDIVFEKGKANVCALHLAREEIQQSNLEDILTEYQVEAVQFDPNPCPETDLQRYDVLIARRGELLKQPPSYLAPLLGQIEDGKFEELKTLTSADYERRKQSDKERAAVTENEIATGRPGYGLIKVENTSASICITTPDELQDAQREMLVKDNGKFILRTFGNIPELRPRTAEAAFRDAKRGDCGAIYAERADLWELIQALRRDNVAYSVMPLWFDPKLVSERAAEIQKREASQAQQDQDEKRRQLEQEALEKRRQSMQGETAAARQNQLRVEHGPQARARAEDIFDAVKALIQGGNSWAAEAFPELASWYRDRTEDGWEFDAINQQIADFGTADWKGRPLEVVITDVSIETKNRLLGEKKTACFRLGLIFDAEFQMRREPFVANCDAASGQDWKQARGFKSEWIAQ